MQEQMPEITLQPLEGEREFNILDKAEENPGIDGFVVERKREFNAACRTSLSASSRALYVQVLVLHNRLQRFQCRKKIRLYCYDRREQPPYTQDDFAVSDFSGINGFSHGGIEL